MTFRTAALTYLALLVLLALTVGSTFLSLGPLNSAINLGVAALKAGLIALIFMHMRTLEGVARLTALVVMVWVGFMFALTWIDYASR
ncbi:MAG TPA: cytochrome C oxidase subunit IV family protein [Devosia sp.]